MSVRGIWVVKQHGRVWRVLRQGSYVASSVHPSREEAIERAAELARRYGGKYRVKDLAGRVVEQQDYSAATRARG
jgi:Uncharacterized protein conserved in bacteria (DUF2188)